MRARIALLALSSSLLAAAAAPAAGAAEPPAVTTVPVSIPASMPDDHGAPVALDGGLTIPSTGCPCAGVVMNHGFLGNWKDQGNVADELARHGYVVLRYSSRGFGRTPGEVDLMGPKERQDLLDAVHWLNDPANPVVGGMVRHNRIGQFGASYGGAHAWALALANDPAVRTVVPTATWTDLYQALLPNDVELLAYVNGFYATGLAPVAAAQDGQASTDDNYSQEMHRWVAEANAGVNLDDLHAGTAGRSPAGRYGDVHIPVFIVQGTNDGLFSANQAIDAYRALAARGVPARLYVGGVGHPPSDSSLDSPEARHVEEEVLAWFDHYLKGDDNGIEDMPPIEYSRADYFHNHWDGTTRSAWSYPLGAATRLHLCTTGATGGTLSGDPCPGAPPAAVVNGYAGRGLFSEPVTAGYAEQLQDGLAQATGAGAADVSGAPPALTYDGPVLEQPLDMAGVPHVALQVASAALLPPGAPRGTAAAFQLDPKLYDVAPDGAAKLLTRGAYAEPLDGNPLGGSASDPRHEVRFDAFGLSNVVEAGHRLRLVLTTEDAPYLRPATNPFAAALLAGSSVELPGADRLLPTPALGAN